MNQDEVNISQTIIATQLDSEVVQDHFDESIVGQSYKIEQMCQQCYKYSPPKTLAIIQEFYNDNYELVQSHQITDEIESKFNIPNVEIDNINVNELLKCKPDEIQSFFLTKYRCRTKNIDIKQLSASPYLKLKKYRNSIYFGEMANNLRHGQGILISEKNILYEGLWQNDLKQGSGFEVLKNQGIYYGQYLNGVPEGKGIFKWPSQESYCGEWYQGKKHGTGKWFTQKGDCYIGCWVAGHTEGIGLHVWVTGDIYYGEVSDNLKHGNGKEIFANGDIYEGSYANGKPNGFGHYQWSKGSIYKGQFTNGLRNGQGKWYRKRGNEVDLYQGEYANDRKCGRGVFKWSNGTQYEGEFYDDKRNGYGEIYWIDGAYYRGDWQNGLLNGQGEFGCEAGVFNGEWKDNKFCQVGKNINSIARVSLSNFPYYHTFRTMEGTLEEKNQVGQIMKIEDDDIEDINTQINKLPEQQIKISNPKLPQEGSTNHSNEQFSHSNEQFSQKYTTQSFKFGKQNKLDKDSLQMNQQKSPRQEVTKKHQLKKLQGDNQAEIRDNAQFSQFTENKELTSQSFTQRITSQRDSQQLQLQQESFQQQRVPDQVQRQTYSVQHRRSIKLLNNSEVVVTNIRKKNPIDNPYDFRELRDVNIRQDINKYINKSVQTVSIRDSFTQTTIEKVQLVPLQKHLLDPYSFNRGTQYSPQANGSRSLRGTIKQTDIHRKKIAFQSTSQRRSPPQKKQTKKPKKLKQYYEEGYDMSDYAKKLIKLRQRNHHVNYLADYELKIWLMKMKKLRINPKKYEDIWNSYIIQKIRRHIYPPVWLPSGFIHYNQ